MGYFCGWDGGGSKTHVLCIQEDGTQLGSGSFGPLNPNGAPFDVVARSIWDTVLFMDQMPGGLNACRALVVGMAGVSSKEAVHFVREQVQTCGYKGKIRIVGDQEIALAGAVEGAGAVLIAGTGSICFGQDEKGNFARTGGWGYLIDDEGSGYALGRDILAAVVQAQDGRMNETVLTELVYKQLGIERIHKLISWLYAEGRSKKEIAALAPLLIQALEQDDHIAYQIAHKAALELTQMAATLLTELGIKEGELALAGSILQHYTAISDEVRRLVNEQYPEIRVIMPHGSPAQGAVKLAARLGE